MSTSKGNPDAEIIALADAIMAKYEETRQLDEIGEAAAQAGDQREWARIRAIIEQQVSEEWDRRARLAGLQATTLAGFRAKARVVRQFSNCSDGYADVYDGDTLAWTLANDLLGLPSVLRKDDPDEEAVS